MDAPGRDHRAAAGAEPLAQPEAVEDAIVDLVTELRSRHAASSRSDRRSRLGDNTQSIVRFSPHLAWREEPLKDRLHERIDLR